MIKSCKKEELSHCLHSTNCRNASQAVNKIYLWRISPDLRCSIIFLPEFQSQQFVYVIHGCMFLSYNKINSWSIQMTIDETYLCVSCVPILAHIFYLSHIPQPNKAFLWINIFVCKYSTTSLALMFPLMIGFVTIWASL